MWDILTSWGKDEKCILNLGPVWSAIVNALKAEQAERQVAAAAVQMLSGDATPSMKLLETPVHGLLHPVCSSASQLQSAIETVPENGIGITAEGSHEWEPDPSANVSGAEGSIPHPITEQSLASVPVPGSESSEEEEGTPGLKTLAERLQRLEVQVNSQVKPPLSATDTSWGHAPLPLPPRILGQVPQHRDGLR